MCARREVQVDYGQQQLHDILGGEDDTAEMEVKEDDDDTAEMEVDAVVDFCRRLAQHVKQMRDKYMDDDRSVNALAHSDDWYTLLRRLHDMNVQNKDFNALHSSSTRQPARLFTLLPLCTTARRGKRMRSFTHQNTRADCAWVRVSDSSTRWRRVMMFALQRE